MEIYRIKNDIDQNQFHLSLSLLPMETQKKIMSFKKNENSKQSLLSEVLIKAIICKKFGVKIKNIFIESNDYGKPYYHCPTKFEFNKSHSGDWVVCAVDSHPVGIDVEIVKELNLDVAKRFFSNEEYQDIISREVTERSSRFYDIWTLKESYVKCLGYGLSIPLNSFTIKVSSDGNISALLNGRRKNLFFKQYHIEAGYKLSVCSCSDNFPEEVIITDINFINNVLISEQ